MNVDPRQVRARRRLLQFAAVCLASFGVFALLPKWRQAREGRYLRDHLPAVPSSIASKALADRISAAKTKVLTGDDPVEATAQLARLYQANGYTQQADLCLQLLERNQPREAQWPYYRADLARTRSDYAAMNEFLLRTVKLAPEYSPARLRLADWQLKNGQTEAAFENYTRRLALVPNDPYARLGLARIALQKNDLKTASTLLSALVSDTPAFSSGHDLYAQLLEANGDLSAATKQRWLGRETGRFRDADDPWLDELTECCYDYPRLLVLGTRDFQTERMESAEHFFRRAIEVSPSAYPAYELLGRLYLKKHDAARARDVLEEGERRAHASTVTTADQRVAQNSRPSAMYFVNLSQAYRELKEPARAIEIARTGLAQLGDNLELEDALGIALGADGQYQEAIAALHRALAFNSNDSDSNYNLALCLRAEGDEAEAVEALQRSLVLQPTFPAALLILARREMEAGRLDQAEKYIQPLYESHPEMDEVRAIALSWRLHMAKDSAARKDYAAAERHYRSAITIDPTNPDVYSELGVMLLVAGQPDHALAWLESYFKMRPNDARGALFLGQAYAMVGRIPDAKRVLGEGVIAAEKASNSATAAHLREILGSLP